MWVYLHVEPKFDVDNLPPCSVRQDLSKPELTDVAGLPTQLALGLQVGHHAHPAFMWVLESQAPVLMT